MSIIWPATLPQYPLQSDYSDRPAQTTIRTNNDTGPAKVRRRTTAGTKPITLSFNMTAAQVSAFETFFETTTAGGALSFQMTHPRTGQTVTVRIVDSSQGESSIQIRPAGGVRWLVSFKVEVLP